MHLPSTVDYCVDCPHLRVCSRSYVYGLDSIWRSVSAMDVFPCEETIEENPMAKCGHEMRSMLGWHEGQN